ncbi:MAG: hypothetical protein AAB320_01345 [Elusimicrobiota bacterium]
MKGRDKLTIFFGGKWPCFHDAEVIDLHFWRGNVRPGDWDARNIFPVLTIKVRILEATQPGAKHAGNDVLATLRFRDVDKFKLLRFDHMNSFLGLLIKEQDRGKRPSGEHLQPAFIVDLESFASFRCSGIDILEAVPESND